MTTKSFNPVINPEKLHEILQLLKQEPVATRGVVEVVPPQQLTAVEPQPIVVEESPAWLEIEEEPVGFWGKICRFFKKVWRVVKEVVAVAIPIITALPSLVRAGARYKEANAHAMSEERKLQVFELKAKAHAKAELIKAKAFKAKIAVAV